MARSHCLGKSSNKSSPSAPNRASQPTPRLSRWPAKFVLRLENYMAAKRAGFELLSTVGEFEQGHSGPDGRRMGSRKAPRTASNRARERAVTIANPRQPPGMSGVFRILNSMMKTIGYGWRWTQCAAYFSLFFPVPYLFLGRRSAFESMNSL